MDDLRGEGAVKFSEKLLGYATGINIPINNKFKNFAKEIVKGSFIYSIGESLTNPMKFWTNFKTNFDISLGIEALNALTEEKLVPQNLPLLVQGSIRGIIRGTANLVHESRLSDWFSVTSAKNLASMIIKETPKVVTGYYMTQKAKDTFGDSKRMVVPIMLISSAAVAIGCTISDNILRVLGSLFKHYEEYNNNINAININTGTTLLKTDVFRDISVGTAGKKIDDNMLLFKARHRIINCTPIITTDFRSENSLRSKI